MVLFPVDTMPSLSGVNIIGHVSRRIRYAGSRSMVSHADAGVVRVVVSVDGQHGSLGMWNLWANNAPCLLWELKIHRCMYPLNVWMCRQKEKPLGFPLGAYWLTIDCLICSLRGVIWYPIDPHTLPLKTSQQCKTPLQRTIQFVMLQCLPQCLL